MNLILLYGAPASGKYSLAKAISSIRGYPILHNHLSIDLALAVYNGFGESDFFEFVAEIRSRCIEKACVNKLENLIVTLCYDETIDKPVVEKWIDIIEAYKGRIYPVFLSVPVYELKNRVVNQSRIGTKKIQCVPELEEVISKYSFSRFEHKNTVIVKSENMSVDETALEVLKVLFK